MGDNWKQESDQLVEDAQRMIDHINTILARSGSTKRLDLNVVDMPNAQQASGPISQKSRTS
jgi:hypothetical protein